ncbi:MAG: peptidoglycan-binding protein [Armatimonadetes bacterium]|nr:peptidoglycan-binding protein [Armatimonadota bacterium]
MVEGALGEDVREIQRRLVKVGRLEPYLVVGRFGAGTLQGVQALQKAHGIPASGVLDMETVALVQTRLYINVRHSSLVVERRSPVFVYSGHEQAPELARFWAR